MCAGFAAVITKFITTNSAPEGTPDAPAFELPPHIDLPPGLGRDGDRLQFHLPDYFQTLTRGKNMHPLLKPKTISLQTMGFTILISLLAAPMIAILSLVIASPFDGWAP